MTPRILIPLIVAMPLAELEADNLLWSDNFDVADSASFDAASLEGRRAGFLANEAVLRSANLQHTISSGMLRLNGGPTGTGAGRVRFEAAPGGASPVVSYDFAASSAASQILSGGGVRVEFDLQATNTTNASSGVSFMTGFPSSSLLAEPTATRLVNAQTDIGIILTNSGASKLYKSGVATTTSSYTPGQGIRHVVIDYGFTSFADGSPVTVNVKVDGNQVINLSHVWSGNSGQFLMELGDALLGTQIDNLQVFDKSAARLGIALGHAVFQSDVKKGDDVGTLSALLGGVPGAASYSLVAGAGDADNAKFQITGDKLEAGNFNFINSSYVEGQQFSVRVRGVSSAGGGQADEKVFLLTLTKDDDSDGLPDAWEMQKAGNLTSLKGDGVADFDQDGLSDLEEYLITQGTSETYSVTLPGLNPIAADTDGDGLKDREELQPGYRLAHNNRPITSPVLADTDGDGISDFAESNTGVYVSASDVGTDPTLVDSDFDGLADNIELTHRAEGYDPNVNDSGLDTDGDGLTTGQEIALGISPFSTDSDGDGLSDGDEVNGTAGLRPPTNPALADTDADGLSDLVETNTGTYVSATNIGTNPARNDTDGDFARDGVEVSAGTNPLSASSKPGPPAGVTLVPLTTDASSGITAAKTYTHKFSCGNSVIINNTSMPPATTSLMPANFTWTSVTATGAAADRLVTSNLPAATGVTGTGLQELLRGYGYSSTGSAPGSRQTFTLSGLTPGQYYDLRLYHRSSTTLETGSGRPIDLVFTNGSEVVKPFQALAEDRPQVMLGSGDINQAYYLSYRYQAQGTTLVIDAIVPLGGPANSGSYYLYGLTNEVAPRPPAITGVARDASGNLVIDFTGAPGKIYRVTKSQDLVTFGPLDNSLNAATDASGVGQVTVPAAEATGPRGFFRIEE